MTIKNISSEILTLVSDPINISIWFEIQRNPDIMSRTLKERLNIKGTKIYRHLNLLEDKKLIISESKIIPNKNILQKTYKVNELMYSRKDVEKRNSEGQPLKKTKETVLFSFYYTALIVNRQIIKIQSLTNQEVNDLIVESNTFLGAHHFLQEEDLKNK